MTQRKIAVIGSNSFSGSDFIDLLLEEEANEVLGISRSPEKSDLFLPYLRHRGAPFTFRQLDLNGDAQELVDCLDAFAPDYVVNFAAQSEVAPSWERPYDWYQTNLVALSHLTQALKRRSYLRRYVHISSPEVYGSCEGTVREDAPLNPSTPYAVSKAAADLHLRTLVANDAFPLVTVRATNVYGARQQLFKIIPRTAIYLRLGRRIPLHGGGAAVKSYIHVRDVSRGEREIMLKGEPGRLYHLSPDAGVEVREVVRMLCERMGRSFQEATETVGERPGQDRAYVIDSTRARQDLGWRPRVGLREGLDEVVAWVEGSWERLLQEPLDYLHKP